MLPVRFAEAEEFLHHWQRGKWIGEIAGGVILAELS
jgi:hypothetical protein